MDQQNSGEADVNSDPGVEGSEPTQDGIAGLRKSISPIEEQTNKPNDSNCSPANPPTVTQPKAKTEEHFPKAKPSQIPDPNSKNQQKKLKRKLEWEEGREARKVLRREKTKAAKQMKREAKQTDASEHSANAADTEEGIKYGRSSTELLSSGTKADRQSHPTQVPITVIIDCQFDTYMTDSERISLGSQITRCYSDNRKARYRAHLAVSSFGGHLKERFDGILAGVYKNWHGVRFRDLDWIEVGKEANVWMRDLKRGGRIIGALAAPDGNRAQNNEHSKLKTSEDGHGEENSTTENMNFGQEKDPGPQLKSEERHAESLCDAAPMNQPQGEIIYLTSDSPNTLSILSPYSTYVIGGIVDKNRHKGVCYKLASEAALKNPGRQIKTAKLPIGDYLAMESRKVLTTNHVNEIMLRWLELGDWGAAFMAVIPKRKGGELRQSISTTSADPLQERDVLKDEDHKLGADDEEIEGY